MMILGGASASGREWQTVDEGGKPGGLSLGPWAYLRSTEYAIVTRRTTAEGASAASAYASCNFTYGSATASQSEPPSAQKIPYPPVPVKMDQEHDHGPPSATPPPESR